MPVAPVARMLAMVEAMTGVFFVSVLIARLVSLYTTEAALDGMSEEMTGGTRDRAGYFHRRLVRQRLDSRPPPV